MGSSPSSIPILPTRPPLPPGWSSCAPSSAPSGSPRCVAVSASPRPRSLPGWASLRAACPRSSTPSPAQPNCAPWPPTSKPSAAAWRSSPTSATSGSPSPNPAPKQPDLISIGHLPDRGHPRAREPASSRSGQPSMILTPRRFPARQVPWEPEINGSQRVQPSPDPARRSQNLLAGEGLPARLSPTVTDTPEFPATEEVTGSNPVRPTVFENLSLGGSQNGSHRRARSRENWPLRSPECPPVRMMIAVVTSVVRCRLLLQCDDPLVMCDGLCALFSQVNNGLRGMLPGSRGLSPSCRTAF